MGETFSTSEVAHAIDHHGKTKAELATVLFLTALSQKFKVKRVRLGLIAVSGCLLAVALYYVITYPVGLMTGDV